MALATLRRLPGFAFEARAPVYEDVLPRLDVAVFVGFAASGPVNVPVPVEDPAHFAAVFGADAPLALDARTGRATHAQLAPAVRAFFANGGRRCWVVRVARGAVSNTLPVPGVAVTSADEEPLAPLLLEARCPGSWSDTLALSASLTAQRVAVLGWPSGCELELTGPNAAAIRAGDLLRARWVDPRVEAYFGVAAATPQPATPARPARTVVRLGDESCWFDMAREPLASAGRARLQGGWVAARLVGDAPAVTLELAIEPHEAPRAGEVIVARFGDAPDVERLVLTVAQVTIAAGADSPRVPAVLVRGRGLWQRPPQTVSHDSPPVPAGAVVERLGLDLWARTSDRDAIRLGDLGLAPGHPRHIARLPDDQLVFAPLDWPDAASWRDAVDPRFPAAGPPAYRPDPAREPAPLPLCIPFGLSVLPERYLPAVVAVGPALARDGLVPFDAALFADEALAASLPSTLVADAEYVRFFAPSPRALAGLHAALPVDEATIIAVPDAAQPGWLAGEAAAPIVSVFDRKSACEETGRFDRCDAPGCAPELGGEGLPGAVLLTWTGEGRRGAFELQRATNPDFGDAEVVFNGVDRSATIPQDQPGDFYYRVRGVGARSTEWSNGISARVPAVGGWRTRSEGEYDAATLVAVHRLLLRFCAARRDVLALLTLPEHYREGAAAAHARALASPASPEMEAARGVVLPIGYGETDALGFGALYHGWALVRDEGGELRAIAPDGPVTGLLARRANERGAWVAPANEPLVGPVALDHPASPSRWQELQQLRVNVLRHEPRGFTVMAADTLAPDEDLRPVGVRRLLILLRRLALRLGSTYVFEPNDEVFRRMVQRGFEAMLGRLFQRGAFAGASAGTAFQVVTGASLNTSASVERGRFFVEIRVAPSRPMAFLTLRLVQVGDRLQLQEA